MLFLDHFSTLAEKQVLEHSRSTGEPLTVSTILFWFVFWHLLGDFNGRCSPIRLGGELGRCGDFA